MTVLINRAHYQGRPCKAVSFRRGTGLAADAGYVDIDHSAFPFGLKLNTFRSIWRQVNDFMYPSPLSMTEYFEERKKHPEVTRLPGIEPGPGLNPFGDLVLKTTDESGSETTLTYRDVFVDASGVEELTADLANIRSHAVGTIRIPVTDIRRYYPDYSPILQRINVRLHGGEFDSLSINPETKLPWTLRNLLDYLFAMLPGSPILLGGSEAFKVAKDDMKGAAPPIVAEGEPAAEWLQKVLDDHGLVAAMQPDGNYSLGIKGSSRTAYGKYATAPGQFEQIKREGYETKTLWITERAPSVAVLGERRIRRQSLIYTPIIQDVDGTFYRLSDVPKLYGLSLVSINRQVLSDPKKSFQDVPPLLGTPGGGQLHSARRKILQTWAYRGYAPEVFFDPEATRIWDRYKTDPNAAKAGGVRAVAIANRIPFFTEEDVEYLPFVPFTEAPWWEDELARANIDIPMDNYQGKGDRGAWVLLPPLVRARRLGQHFFQNINALNVRFAELVAQEETAKNNLEVAIGLELNLLRDIGETIMNFSALRQSIRTDVALARDLALRKYGIEDFEDVDKVLASWFEEAGAPADGFLRTDGEKQRKKELQGYKTQAIQRIKNVAAFRAHLKAITEHVTRLRVGHNNFVTVYKELGGLQLWGNIPWGVVEEGTYTLDARTGIVLFSQPACHMLIPYMVDREQNLTVGLDGGVVVTFGFELNANNHSDWTLLIYTPDDKGGAAGDSDKQGVPGGPGPGGTLSSAAGGGETTPGGAAAAAAEGAPTVKFSAFGSSLGAGLKLVRAPGMRLYEAEGGTPFNATELRTQAQQKANAQLSRPRQVTGYNYQLPGFVGAVVGDGTELVSHEFDGDVARTTVSVNSPKSRLHRPGPRQKDVQKGRVEAREQVASKDWRSE